MQAVLGMHARREQAPHTHLGSAGVSDTGSRTTTSVSLAPYLEAWPATPLLTAYARTLNVPRLAGASISKAAVPEASHITVLKTGVTWNWLLRRSAALASPLDLAAAG